MAKPGAPNPVRQHPSDDRETVAKAVEAMGR
jgi:hypothetical protein